MSERVEKSGVWGGAHRGTRWDGWNIRLTGAKKDVQSSHENLKKHSRNQQHMKWPDNMQIQEEHYVISGIRISSSREDNTASKIPLARVCSKYNSSRIRHCQQALESSRKSAAFFFHQIKFFFFIIIIAGLGLGLH